MTGKKTGLVGRIRQEMDRENPKFYRDLHGATVTTWTDFEV
jgi:hypothetical protein